MAGRGKPWRSWLAFTRFWWRHRNDRGFHWVRVDTAYGFWCDQHQAATMYTGGHGIELEAQLGEAARVIAAEHINRIGRHM